MKKFALPFVALAFSCTALNLSVHAQQTNTDSLTALAHQLGIQSVDIPGFIRLHSGENQTTETNFRAPENMAPLNMANPGFETGDFTGWTGYIGYNDISSYGPLSSINFGIFSTTVNAPISDLNARHTIMTSAAGNDPCSMQAILQPGYGNYVVRLGNNYATYQGESLIQLWNITSADTDLFIGYSLVLNDGGHLPGEQPYFYYLLTDTVTHDTIAYKYATAGGTDSSFVTCPSDPTTAYRAWAIDTADLSAYIGGTARLQFVVAACIYGGHYGYCYVDADPYDTYSVGMNENETSSFNVYPNPSNGIFNLNFAEQNKSGIITVRDLPGKTILTSTFSNSGNVQLDLSAQAKGIYFVTMENENGISTQRIVVE